MMADMSARRATNSTVRPWSAVLLAGALVVGVAGCSWHLEKEPVVYPSADAVTLERDDAAAREQHVLDVLGSGSSDGVSASDLASIEAQAAPAHLEALGGVYVATPSPAPSPSPFTGSLDDAVTQAREGALETATTTTDSNLALLQSSMGLTHAFALWWAQNTALAETLQPTPSPTPLASPSGALPGEPEPNVTGEPSTSESAIPAVSASPEPIPVTADERVLPTSVDLGDAFLPASADAISPVTLGDLAVAHDRARFLYEVIAAKSAGEERANALARRDIHAARADEFGALAGDQDRRQELYDVPPTLVDTALSRAVTARETEFALGTSYAAMLDGVTTENRGWILNAAFDAFAAGSLQPGFTPDKFPVLPGLQPVG